MRLSGRGSPHAPCRRPHRCSREDLWGNHGDTWGSSPSAECPTMRRLPLSIHIHSSSSHCHYVRAFEIRKRASLGPSSLTYIPSLIVIPAFYPHRIRRLPRTAGCVLCARASVTRDGLRFNKPNDPDYEDYEKDCQILLDETSHVHGWVTSAVEPVVLRVRWCMVGWRMRLHAVV